MEHKARKYCMLYKINPSNAITCIYKELSQNFINGIGILLIEWCLYAAENDYAFIDLMIPIDWHQLNDFVSELLSFESNDSLIIARAIRILKNQNATTSILMNLAQALRGCSRNVDICVLLSVIYARIGRDKECLRYLAMLSETKESIPVLRSRLYLLSVADLQLLKLTMESNQSTNTNGLKNKGYNREDSFESSYKINQSIDVSPLTSSTINLQRFDGKAIESSPNTSDKAAKNQQNFVGKTVKNLQNSGCTATTSPTNSSGKTKLERANRGLAYDEVCKSLLHLMELDIFLDCIIKTHLDADRPYIACWLALEHFNEKQKLPKFEINTAKSLHQFILKHISDLFEIVKREEEKETSLSDLRERAVRYCKIALKLAREDKKTRILYLKCLYENKQITEALSMGREFLQSDDIDNYEFLQIISYCKMFLGEYQEALDVLNTISDTKTDCVESTCARGFASCLSGRTREGIDDVIIACANDISVTLIAFRKMKPSDQDKIRVCITEYIAEKVAAFGDQCGPKESSNHSQYSLSESSYNENASKLNYLIKLCEFLTKLYTKDLQVQLLYVEVLLKMQRHGDAQKTLVLFIRRVPDDPLPMVHLANVRMRLGAYIAAVEDFRVIIRAIGCAKFSQNIDHLCYDDRNNIARVLRKHGFQHLQHQSYADAIECFDIAIIALADAAAGLTLVRAFSFANLGDYELALNDFKAVLEQESENLAANIGCAVIYAVLGYEEESLESISVVFGDNRDAMIKVLQKLPYNCVMQLIATVENYARDRIENNVQDITGDDYDTREIRPFIEFLNLLHQRSNNIISLNANYFILCGDYDEALKTIKSGLKSAQMDPILMSKMALVNVKMSRMKEAVDILRFIATDDKYIIENDMKHLTSAERDSLIEAAITHADNLNNASNYKEAKEHYDLAISLMENKDIDILRSRFMCLLNEGLVQQALGDISLVIETKPMCQDYCIRAKLLDSMGKEKAACFDYIMALELDEETTVTFLKEEAILKHVLCIFCTASSSAFVREQYQDVLKYCEYGLKLDPNHKGMKQLRYRTKCIMNKCIIQ